MRPGGTKGATACSRNHRKQMLAGVRGELADVLQQNEVELVGQDLRNETSRYEQERQEMHAEVERWY